MNNLERLLKAADFAAKKHKCQTRKGINGEPYINHPLEVAHILASVGKVEDADILIAAILHDTVEDTETTKEDIIEMFGKNVAEMVMEVTDDKTLPKAKRKQKQIEHAPHLSVGAKQIKLADKTNNISDILHNPPENWSDERRIDYIKWGEKVVAGLRGVNKNLENNFDELITEANSKLK